MESLQIVRGHNEQGGSVPGTILIFYLNNIKTLAARHGDANGKEMSCHCMFDEHLVTLLAVVIFFIVILMLVTMDEL